MPLTIAKQTTDVHSNVLFQYVCNEYMTKYDFAAHLDKARDVYRAKCNLMLDTMRRTLPSGRSRSRSRKAACSPWPSCRTAWIRSRLSARRFSAVYSACPCSAFLADEKQVSNAFRLNYSTPTDEQIVKGIEILGKLTHEWIKE